ncbi:hypothetical protein [Agromyces seonyuensis]|uniref:hypothetical protein n=1 Tax=Agromyces seonyuensis TaxID=2662446 RepID=UPI001924ACBC|nr:hypothetical protein [Agromyces seonyuensis]
MRVELRGVSKGRRGHALPSTTISFESGRASLARAETELRPSILGLIASGRMTPDSGEVLLDGRADRKGLRRRVALVDAPSVNDPAHGVTVAGVAAEELMFAGIPSNPISVSRWLDQLGFAHLARRAIDTVAPRERIRLLTELAILRDDVEALVVVAPDRHGGDPLEWWALAQDLAARGFAVLVVAGDASSAALGAADLIARLHGTDVDPDSAAAELLEGGLA